MKVEKISGSNFSLDNDDPKKEQKRFESIQEIDRKHAEYERFRRETGTSPEEFKKQTNRARKIGFDAMLSEEMRKNNPK